MNENCETSAVAAILEVMDGRLARIERAVANPKPEPIDARLGYSRRHAASALGVSTWTIDRARKQGLLKEAQRLGQRDVRLTGESLLVFQHERQNRKSQVVQIL